MKKITLVTTKGCTGCNIMEYNIKQALKEVNKDNSILFERIDAETFGKKAIRTFNITDFPTILLFKDDNLKLKYVGSMPIIVILRWIDVYFK